MRDYAEISKALRCCHLTSERGCEECPFGLNNNEKCANLLLDAADAIEELQAAVPHWISVDERLPEHGDLIDRDAFEADARKRYCSACNNYNGAKCRACWVDDMLGDVADFDAVIPQNKEETE